MPPKVRRATPKSGVKVRGITPYMYPLYTPLFAPHPCWGLSAVMPIDVKLYGEGPILFAATRARQIINDKDDPPKPPADAPRDCPLRSALPEWGRYARLRRADFARSARRFWALYAPIVRPAGAQYARLRRARVRKTPAGSARAFRGCWVDLPSSLKNGLQTPPDCPQIGF